MPHSTQPGAVGLGSHDVAHQPVARNAGMSCTRVPTFGLIAAKGQVGAASIQHKHVHVAVMVGLVLSVMLRRNWSREVVLCSATALFTRATVSSAVPLLQPERGHRLRQGGRRDAPAPQPAKRRGLPFGRYAA